jgi:hypothetical protein
MVISAELIRGNDILIELQNLNFEYRKINDVMFTVWQNKNAMEPLMVKAKEIRLRKEALEKELNELNYEI